MRSSTWLQVHSVDLDGAQNPYAIDRLAYPGYGEFFGGAKAHANHAVFEDDFVGATLGLF